MCTPGQPIQPPEELGEMPGDWTPEQQIAHMLDLCEAQMESALSESDVAVDALIKAFTRIANTSRTLDTLAKELSPAASASSAASDELQKQVATIREQMAAAVIAFQFYDKLTQRLGHVRYSLSSLAMFVCNRSQTAQREQWQRLFTTLRRLYRTQEERELFERIIVGAAPDDAQPPLASSKLDRQADAPRPGDIELF
jgi:hypothetical protein